MEFKYPGSVIAATFKSKWHKHEQGNIQRSIDF